MFAELVEGRVVTQSAWHEKDLAKQVPGAHWDTKLKAWVFELSWATCVQLRGVLGPQLEVGPALNEWAWTERCRRIEPAVYLRELLEFPTAQAGFNTQARGTNGTQLYPFQVVGREYLIVAEDAGLFDEMGTGKSPTTLAAIEQLEEERGEGLPAVVICPNSVKGHWENLTPIWAPKATPYVVRGGLAERKKLLKAASEDPTALVIINFEAVRAFSRLAGYGSIKLAACRECRSHGNPDLTPTRCEVHPKELNQLGFKVCVLDEAHRVKDPKAKQTRATWAVFHGPTVLHRFALTGTPLANHPGDLWPIMHAVAPRDFPTKSTYIDRYAMFSWSSNGELEIVGIRGDTKEELFRILDPRFRRVTKDLVLPWLPPKVRTTRQVEMTPMQKKAYVEIEKEAVTKLDDGTLLVLKSNLVGATRLLQLASSYATVEPDGQLELREPSPKLDVLEEVLEEMAGRPVVIAAEHRRLLELASARLEKRQIPHVMFTGGVIEAERALNLKAFNEGQVNVLLFTFKAGGVGIDLSHADTMVRLQRSWSLVDSLQAEDRVHRIGSERHEAINIIDLITTDTIEVEQVKRLYTKLERLEEIVRDRERRIRAGLTVDELDAEASVIMNTWLGDAA